MDCQMPEMDGYEATARDPPPRGRRPAHAGHRDDRRRHRRASASAASAAGMDDYLSKPVDPPRSTPRWSAGCRSPELTDGPVAADGYRDEEPRRRRSPTMKILAVSGALPAHSYPQDEITDAFAEVIAQRRPRPSGCCAASTPTPASSAGTLALPLEEYARSTTSARPTTSSSSTRSSSARGPSSTR